MEVETDNAQNVVEHEGRRFYFCSRGCMLDFMDDPGKYLDPDYKPMGMEGH
jgi:YHS domain-containing protein